MNPHSPIAEQTLLGMLMFDNDRIELVEGRITEADFFIPLHAAVFTEILKLHREGIEAAPPTLIPRLSGKSGDDAELNQFCVKAFENAATMRNVSGAAHVVSELTMQRRMIANAKLLTEAATSNDLKMALAIQKEIAGLAKGFTDFEPETTSEQVKSAIKAAHKKDKMMRTGLSAWDRVFGGIFREKIYTISGHGGAGKSALGVTIGWNMAKAGHRVRWVSWEEDREAVWSRILARECLIDSKCIREGNINAHQGELLMGKGSEVVKHDFLSYYGLKDKNQIVDACGQCDLIVIDGLSRYPTKGANLIDRVQEAMREVGEICLATGASVLLLAHVNGESVKNGAGIGSIFGGQAATFDPEGIVDIRRSDDMIGDAGRRAITLTVIKNRYGPEGVKVPMWFEGAYMRFYEQGQTS